MLVMVDNFDSFTYNLVQYFYELGEEVRVFRNNAITVDEIESMSPSHLVISPGPGRPKDGGISLECIDRFKGQIPILGVCLGHQCIGEYFGGKIINADAIMHGKTSNIHHDCSGVFADIENPFLATRYHSLAIDRKLVPEELNVTARTEDGEIMGVQHKTLPIYGVQFHPESILSEFGHKLLRNFLNILKK